MKRKLLSLMMAGLAAAAVGAAPATPSKAAALASPFEAANRLTAEGGYDEGSAAYDAIASGGRTSPALEYNRSQASLKAGQVGRAWAHLRLADRLAPRDSAIQMATEQLAPRIPGGNGSALNGVRWMGVLTLNEWAGLALVCMWIFGGLLFAVRFAAGWKDRLRTPRVVSGGVALVTSALLGLAMLSRWWGPDVVVLRPAATVRVSPLDEARTAFSLTEGSEVRSQGTRGDWVMIEEPVSRRFGWIKRSDVLVLPFR